MIEINYMDSFDGANMRPVEIIKILELIKKGHWKNKIESIQECVKNNDVENVNVLKKELPAFTVSATFDKKRRKENLESYTGLLHLDYDKLKDVKTIKEKVINIPFTYAAFISPSGNGLKVLVRSDAEASSHTDAFDALKSYYDKSVGSESDKSVKDITRLCFVSYDSSLYLNESSETFSHLTFSDNSNMTQQVDIDWVWNFTAKKEEFIDGNRNNFIYLLACNANRFGVEMDDVISYASNHCDSTFNFDEIERTIKSGYQNNAHENGSVAKPAKLAKSIYDEDLNPFIPETVYDSLPQILKDMCKVFTGRERDVFLTSALSVISGGLHNVVGHYSNEIVFPNLFSFIVAPPASGKGSMKYAKQLGDCYHDYLLNRSREAQKEYKKEKRIFERKFKRAKSDQEIEQLIEPNLPKSNLFFIPADTSSSMLIKHLQDNDGLGCICETEADTLSNTLKQDWGGYSDVLRKGFQSEVISKSRITDLQYSEIKEPKFSLAITGTPNQMDSLITSVQDGLFSRFLFYSFKPKLVWNDTYTSKISKSKKDLFAVYSADLCDKFKSIAPREFQMTQQQGEDLDKRFSIALKYNTTHYSEHVSGITYRLGLMSFKIAMVLTALRSEEKEILCTNEDFDIAMCLVEKVYMPHNLNMLNMFDRGNKTLTIAEQHLLDWMPIEKPFRRVEISEEAKRLEISDRSLTDILRKFINLKYLDKIKNGLYTLTDKVTSVL